MMPHPYYQDESVTLFHGDSIATLRALPDASVNCCITSPPYFGLRDYGNEGQHGLEASPAEYVETMRTVFAEVRRVLADDGTLWLNLGDSYYSGRGNPGPNSADEKQSARRGFTRSVDKPGQPWSSPKNLLGIPWRVAFALQDDGWILRNDIIWTKPNAMPESVTDRLSTKHEHLFMFSKSRAYWFDVDPIREVAETADRPGPRRSYAPGSASSMRDGEHQAMTGPFAGLPLNENGKNPGDVWSIPTQPFPGAHFAVMAPELARRAIVAGCKPGGTVLDPYSGSGTTGWQATKNGRRYVGIDLSRDYLDLSLRTRLAQGVLDFGEAI
jgi:site-specific DNA-methyltransferase (cytosine-N4-specific)